MWSLRWYLQTRAHRGYWRDCAFSSGSPHVPTGVSRQPVNQRGRPRIASYGLYPPEHITTLSAWPTVTPTRTTGGQMTDTSGRLALLLLLGSHGSPLRLYHVSPLRFGHLLPLYLSNHRWGCRPPRRPFSVDHTTFGPWRGQQSSRPAALSTPRPLARVTELSTHDSFGPWRGQLNSRPAAFSRDEVRRLDMQLLRSRSCAVLTTACW